MISKAAKRKLARVDYGLGLFVAVFAIPAIILILIYKLAVAVIWERMLPVRRYAYDKFLSPEAKYVWLSTGLLYLIIAFALFILYGGLAIYQIITQGADV